MPLGDVRVTELAGLIQDRINDQVDYLRGLGAFVDDSDDVEDMRKGMGSGRRAFRISPAPETMSPEPRMSNVIVWRFSFHVTVLFRKMGGMAHRNIDETGIDLSRMTKDVVNALQGERLGVLNQGGLDCGPARWMEGGPPAEAVSGMRFLVTGRSRESRTTSS